MTNIVTTIAKAVQCGLVIVTANIPLTANASGLTYTPVNPTFGGSPLNGSYILGLASANNSRYLQNPATSSQNSGPTTAQQFKNEITSALLSEIASQVSQQIIGENANTQGSFNLAGEIIQFNRANGQININITDATTGGQTQIQIPVPNY